MLLPMPQPAPAQPSPSLSSFAGLLASFATPPPPSDAADDAALWSSSDLGEDVATLTYESALRTHARYRPANREFARDSDRSDASLTDAWSGTRADAPSAIGTADAVATAGATEAARAIATADALNPAGAALAAITAPDRDLRSTSVTIRLSRMESARLHQRAAEAGLTLSAYLRSCAIEAEALRAQVKQALAELKAGSNGAGRQEKERPEQRNLYGWVRGLLRRER